MDLKSFKRNAPNHGWAYVIFILKDGTTYPALHFHSGGSKAMLQFLGKTLHIQRWAWLLSIYLIFYVKINTNEIIINIHVYSWYILYYILEHCNFYVTFIFRFGLFNYLNWIYVSNPDVYTQSSNPKVTNSYLYFSSM